VSNDYFSKIGAKHIPANQWNFDGPDQEATARKGYRFAQMPVEVEII
jgi:hypothetical protein